MPLVEEADRQCRVREAALAALETITTSDAIGEWKSNYLGKQGAIAKRTNGVMIANAPGTTPAYSLGPLQERGKLFAAEGDNVYEGQLIGIHSKDNDLTVNAIKPKPLTNMRASGKDDAIKLSPAIKYTLEQALDFIEDDELVEVTPKEIRLRKKHLTENERKRASRS